MDPLSQTIVTVLVQVAADKTGDLAGILGPKAWGAAQALWRSTLERLRRDPAGAVVADEFEQDPATYARPLQKKLEAALRADAELKAMLEALLAAFNQHSGTGGAVDVGAGGAAATGAGSTAVGARGVQVEGAAKGPIITGDGNIVTGDISGTGIAIGRGAQARVEQGLSEAQLARLFGAIYDRIQRRPADPTVDGEEITAAVRGIEKEASLGDEARPERVEARLQRLADMAPDIFAVTVDALTNPLAGLAAPVVSAARRSAGSTA